MPLLYERSENDGDIQIQVKTAWYLVRYGVLALIVALLLLRDSLEAPIAAPVFVAMVALVTVRIVGFWPARRELMAAMRTSSLSVSGSTWNPKQPLRYGFRAPPPQATTVSPRD